MSILLEHYTIDGEILIEKACRVCYQSFHRFNPPDSTKELIQKILKQGHFSVLEHATATFRFNGVSRVLTHELVRHRLMSPSQESQRYVVYADKSETDQPGIKGKARKKTKDFDYHIPQDIAEMDELFYKSFPFEVNDHYEEVGFNYHEIIDLCYKYYEFLLSKGIKPEDARYVLPNATACDIYCTANLREWRHICYVRCHPAAHWEIRELMIQVKDKLKEIFANVFYDFPCGPLTEEDYKGIIIT
jgi:thymidylate synthase (FAD)